MDCAVAWVFQLSTVDPCYVSQGLRADLERLSSDAVTALIASLITAGVSNDLSFSHTVSAMRSNKITVKARHPTIASKSAQ